MASYDQPIVWAIVGLIGEDLRGSLSSGSVRVLALSTIFPGLDAIAISLRDVVSALVGSLIVPAALWFWNQ
jgi:hypothetical protein